MRMVPPFSLIFNWLTIGMTTADEVPPKMAPNTKPVRMSNFSITMPKRATTIMVTKKLIAVSLMVPLMEVIKVLKFNSVPLSNRMMTRVMVVNTLATDPNDSGFTQCSTGPMTKPMAISINTSGMRLRLKISVKRCAAKINKPKMAMTKPVWSETPRLPVWVTVSCTVSGCTMVSNTEESVSWSMMVVIL